MLERVHHESFGEIRKTIVTLCGAGNSRLETLGCLSLNLSQENNTISVTVYIVRCETKLLLRLPAIRKLGLIHDVLGNFSVTAAEHKNGLPSLRTKADVVHAYLGLFHGLG